jgi:hypothetical protein
MNGNNTAQRSKSVDQYSSSVLKTAAAQNDKVNITKLVKTQVVSVIQQNHAEMYSVTFIFKFKF